MSFSIASLASWFTTTEADVVALIGKIKAEVAVAEADVTEALNWVAKQTPTVAAALQEVLGVVEVIGVGSNPEVATAIAAANAAVTALNAFAAAQTSPAVQTIQTDGAAVVAGYQALTQSLASQAAVKAAAATAAAPAPAAA